MPRPEEVDSPKARWKLCKVLYSSGEGGYAVAKGKWDNEAVLGIRWNGKADEIGNPQSSGKPTWFIVPHDIESAVRESIDRVREKGLS